MSGGFLLVAFAAVAAGGLRLEALRRSRRDRRALGDTRRLRREVSPPGYFVQGVRVALVAAGAGLLAAAATGAARGGPAAGGGPPVDPSARATVLLLDASNSMRARDVEPSRLERARALARRLVVELPGPVGVAVFAGRGYVLSPLTVDRDALNLFLDAVDPGGVGRGGSSPAEGLRQALGLLAGARAGGARSVILFSDGEETVEAAPLEEMLGRAVEAGIRVHTVGVGSAGGARIPVPVEGGVGEEEARTAWLRDPAGEVVVSRLEEDLLRRVSEATAGLYVPGTEAGIEALLDRIDAVRTTPAASGPAGLLLLLLAFLALGADAWLFRRG